MQYLHCEHRAQESERKRRQQEKELAELKDAAELKDPAKRLGYSLTKICQFCGNTRIRTKVQQHTRQHLNDLLYDNGVAFINRSDNHIDVYVDVYVDGTSKLSQIVKWLERSCS